MPHEHVALAQTANGEIGPKWHECGIRLTFGNSMVHNEVYLCWKCYVAATGADSSTKTHDTESPFWQQ